LQEQAGQILIEENDREIFVRPLLKRRNRIKMLSLLAHPHKRTPSHRRKEV